MDKDEAWKAIKAVEDGDLPSGSVIMPITGPNSLLTPGGEPIPGVPVKYTVVSDEHSDHNLPIGATVEPCEPPDWYEGEATWFTMGGDGDEVSIDPRDLAVTEDKAADPDERDGTPKFKVPAYEGEDYSTSAIYNTLLTLFWDKGTQGILDGDGDPIGDNIKRAKFAVEAVRTYAKETGVYTGENIYLAISDLMNDLRHLLDYIGLDEESDASDGYPIDLEVMASRDMHYQAEIRGLF